jgi:hypothetical protein
MALAFACVRDLIIPDEVDRLSSDRITTAALATARHHAGSCRVTVASPVTRTVLEGLVDVRDGA